MGYKETGTHLATLNLEVTVAVSDTSSVYAVISGFKQTERLKATTDSLEFIAGEGFDEDSSVEIHNFVMAEVKKALATRPNRTNK